MTQAESWTFVGVSGVPSPMIIEGVDVWKFPWKRVALPPARVKDPRYNQEQTFDIYEVCNGGHIVRFAAGEFSPGVYGFYQESP